MKRNYRLIWTIGISGILCIVLLLLGSKVAGSNTKANKKEGVKMSCDRTIHKGDSTGNKVDTTSGDCGQLNMVDVMKQSASPGRGDGKAPDGRASGGNTGDTKGSQGQGSDVKSTKGSEPDEQTMLDMFAAYDKQHKEPPIGDATMDEAGTIKVRIRTFGGMHADGSIEYKKGSEHYDKILKHLGGIKPGEFKLVAPYPDEPETRGKGGK